MSDRKIDAAVDPSWKSADELAVSPSEYMALIALREAFIKGDIRHVEIKEHLFSGRGKKIKNPRHDCKMFNLAWELFKDAACGTSYCIGGWMFQIMRPGASERDTLAYVKAGRSQALHDLFYGYSKGMKNVKELDAAQAIGRFLSGQRVWL